MTEATTVIKRIERTLAVFEKSLAGNDSIRNFLDVFRSFLEGKVSEEEMTAAAAPLREEERSQNWLKAYEGKFLEIERRETINNLFKAAVLLSQKRHDEALAAAQLAEDYNQCLASGP